jgi:hypothetical protein
MIPPTRTRPRNGRSVKAKGYNFEKHVLAVLQQADPEAKRNGNVYGSADRGDLDSAGLDLIIQVKDTKNQPVRRVLNEAMQQAVQAERRDWIVVHRNREGDAYAPHERNLWTVEEDFALRLLKAYGLWLTFEQFPRRFTPPLP